MERIMSILHIYKNILRYIKYSMIVTIFDIYIVNLLMSYLSVSIVAANTIGVVVGFLIHYFLSIKNVFAMKLDRIVFIVYLVTFLMGLALADYIIWILYEEFNFGFLICKGVSIVIPFFVMYNMRKYIYKSVRDKYNKK